MRKRWIGMMMAAVMTVSMLSGCGSPGGKEESQAVSGTSGPSGTETAESGSSAESGEKEDEKVLRVGMECAYAPFNWTQENPEVANGETAVPIYGSNYYAYGYDVMMAKKIAEPNDLIVVTGSFYTIKDIEANLDEK